MVPKFFSKERWRNHDTGTGSMDAQTSLPTPTTQSNVPAQSVQAQNVATAPLKAPRDLWKEAFDVLSQKDRDALRAPDANVSQGDASSKIAAIEEVIGVTERKYEEYCQRGWYTKKGDTTRETNMRIRTKEILCSALEFKHIVDQGLKFDPSGYGTIVWAAVSGALTLMQNDKDKMEAIYDSAAVMTAILPKYAIIESQYRDQPTQEQAAFENRILDLYADLLRYAAHIKAKENHSSAGKFWTLDIEYPQDG